MKRRVLIVDDSKLARMAMAKVLNALEPGWTRVEAANAEEALAAARQGSVDITLLDFNMPGRDGLELVTALRALDAAMPVAVVSANHQEELVRRARDLGAAFLPKPLTEQALKEFLAGAVRRLDRPAG